LEREKEEAMKAGELPLRGLPVILLTSEVFLKANL
jgi:hypothetical protein